MISAMIQVPGTVGSIARMCGDQVEEDPSLPEGL